MHLVTFIESNQNRIGILDNNTDEVVDLSTAPGKLPDTMLEFIAQGSMALAEAQRVFDTAKGRIPLDQLRLLAPIPRPSRNVICLGKNYREHIKEVQTAKSACSTDGKNVVPDKPIFFTKATSAVIGPGEPILAWVDPTASTDYEGELAVIIGKAGRGIKADEAMQYVYGYTILNDVTSRRLQLEHQQWFLGKSLDSFCPMGPVIVTADEIPDVTTLRIQTWVNDELRQDDVVASLIFDIATLIETLSRTTTLEPGDIIATGTPAGVGMGFKPPRFLQKGDVVKIRIDPIGILENPVA